MDDQRFIMFWERVFLCTLVRWWLVNVFEKNIIEEGVVWYILKYTCVFWRMKYDMIDMIGKIC